MKWFRRTPLGEARWAVIDCETSGLDPARDRLLSVAAVPVRGARVETAGAYHALIRQEVASAKENILIHGIGGDAQASGRPLQEVLAELESRVGEAIPVAFHAPFDRAVLRRAGLHAAARRWLDLAVLAPAFFPGRAGHDLDGWLTAFAIDCPARHDALADAYATAQLLLVMLAEARRQGVASAEALLRLSSSSAWLGRLTLP